MSRFRLRHCLNPLILPALLALLLLNPISAHAAPTGTGTFDCLGDLDWGCRILSFLFDTTDNSVTYIKNGATVTDTPSTVQPAFRAMLGFFSNAMLILASVKLLFELLQMVAETAHTGQVGGRDTNTLWAPIRLVVAIGLLVPLSSGLNSGQHVILQMAKWGSGLASQTWKLFAEKLGDNQALANPSVPRYQARNAIADLFRVYTCMAIVNGYARDTSRFASFSNFLGYNYVKARDAGGFFASVPTQRDFGDGTDRTLCGTIRYTPTDTVSTSAADAANTKALVASTQRRFLSLENDLKALAERIAPEFRPGAADHEMPSTAEFDKLADDFIKAYEDEFRRSNIGTQAFRDITNNIKNAANEQGWTSAGVWFLALTRAQGQILNAGYALPAITPPNDTLITSHQTGNIANDYQRFKTWLVANPSLANRASTMTSVGGNPVDDSSSWHALNFGAHTIDTLLWAADKILTSTGLWADDPYKAFGDIASSRNPFGEIGELGYKKIRAGLDLMGWALLSNLGSSVTSWGQERGATKDKSWLQGIAKSGVLPYVSSGLSATSTVLLFLAGLLMTFGVVLAFLVPLIPFTHFFFAMLAWFGTLLEGMVSMPFLALAHLTPKGEGFAGPNTKQGYYYAFQILLRPVLIVFGLVCAYLMFYVAAKFLNSMYAEAARSVREFSGGTWFVAKFTFSILYVVLIYICANTSFKLVERIPAGALRWMGASAQENTYDDQGTLQQMTTLAGGWAAGEFTQLPNKFVAEPLKKSVADKIEDRKKDDKSKLATTRHDDMLNAVKAIPASGAGTAAAAAPPMSDVDRAQHDWASSQRKVEGLENEEAQAFADWQATKGPSRAGARANLDLVRNRLSRARNEAHQHQLRYESLRRGTTT